MLKIDHKPMKRWERTLYEILVNFVFVCLMAKKDLCYLVRLANALTLYGKTDDITISEKELNTSLAVFENNYLDNSDAVNT